MGKDFKAKARQTELQGIISGTDPQPQDTPEAAAGAGADPQPDDRFDKPQKAVYYRFNLKMPLEYEEYLKKAAINASVSAGRQITVTEYINMLIREDKKAHGES